MNPNQRYFRGLNLLDCFNMIFVRNIKQTLVQSVGAIITHYDDEKKNIQLKEFDDRVLNVVFVFCFFFLHILNAV